MAMVNELQQDMKRSKVLSLDVMREHSDQLETVFTVLGDLVVHSLGVTSVVLNTPHLDIPVADKKVPFGAESERQWWVAYVIDIVLEKPIIDSSLPSRLNRMAVLGGLPSAESRLSELDAHLSKTALNRNRGDIKPDCDFGSAFACEIKQLDLIFGDVAIGMMSGSDNTGGPCAGLSFRATQNITAVPLSPLDSHALQVIGDGLERYTEVIADLLEGHMFIDIQTSDLMFVSERSHGFTSAGLVRAGNRAVERGSHLETVAGDAEVASTMEALTINPTFALDPSRHAVPPIEVISNGYYNTERVQAWL